MKVKFVDGSIKECAVPTEHKVFKSIGGSLVDTGWILTFRIIDNISSSEEVDTMLETENILSLEFLSETEDGELTTLFNLEGYEKVISSIIHYSEDVTMTNVEIQLSKGV